MVFCKVVGFAIPEKWQSVQKKGQAETCPPPKGGQNENHLDNTTKIYLVKQKTPESVP
jgi:hypothetical protein